MSAYYNEIDPFAAAWLRELIKAGLIADGEVDERDIRDVRADDLRGFVQCHFFAGIGGWSYALRIAGWPDDRSVWTGSCPCQPFSSAGKRQGGADDRHLWPHWARLVRECRPVAIIGEQVESAIAHGWLDAVFDDLEREGYTCGAASLPATSVGAPHIRQRLWFVADCAGARRDGWTEVCSESSQEIVSGPSVRGKVGALADAERRATERRRHDVGTATRDIEGGTQERQRLQPDARDGGESASFWFPCDWLPCRDGKARPVEPGTFPLAHGIPGRVGRLRGYGNAIVPQVAAAFIEAYLEAVA